MTRRTPTLSPRIAALIAGVVVVPAVAFAAVAEGDLVGTSEAEIRKQLTSMGYEVTEIEVEDDEIEADVVLNGQQFEIEINPETGKVTEIEADDD